MIGEDHRAVAGLRDAFMLGIYERPGASGELADPPYPKNFVVDYFRAYQPDGGYRND